MNVLTQKNSEGRYMNSDIHPGLKAMGVCLISSCPSITPTTDLKEYGMLVFRKTIANIAGHAHAVQYIRYARNEITNTNLETFLLIDDDDGHMECLEECISGITDSKFQFYCTAGSFPSSQEEFNKALLSIASLS
jgi:hypothetical protein